MVVILRWLVLGVCFQLTLLNELIGILQAAVWLYDLLSLPQHVANCHFDPGGDSLHLSHGKGKW